jgi:hypothetical protein
MPAVNFPVRTWRYSAAINNGDTPMNTATLMLFRDIAASMQSDSTDWQWIGPHMSQRMFGITEKRAKAYAERHGGTASKMELKP